MNDAKPTHNPLIAAGVLLGAGLGGFVDGIVLHQILQLHNLLSARISPDDLVGAKINMFWDGLFHAAVWLMTACGLILLWRAMGRSDVPRSGAVFLGALVAGWGLFNLIEGVIDHHILGVHHVVERAADKLPADLAFTASGIVFLVIGAMLIRRGKREAARRETVFEEV